MVEMQLSALQLTRLLRGSNTSTVSNKNPENKRRDLIVLAALIEHPDVGLILFETGCAEDIDVVRLFHHSNGPSPLTAEEMGRPINRRVPSH